MKKWTILAVLLMIVAGSIFWLIQKYTVRTVLLEANLHYTEEEIKNFVMSGPLGKNSLYLSLKYRNKGVENIPFVDVMDVDILSPDSIKITVYEKALAGYIEYMDTFMYFDREGYVVECSNIKTEGIPLVAGLWFDHMMLGERLPVSDTAVFETIMELTKLLTKYELQADRIFFSSAGDITIYFEQVKAALGNDIMNLENKMMRLPQLLSKLENQKGTLRMENLTEEKSDITFQMEE